MINSKDTRHRAARRVGWVAMRLFGLLAAILSLSPNSSAYDEGTIKGWCQDLGCSNLGNWTEYSMNKANNNNYSYDITPTSSGTGYIKFRLNKNWFSVYGSNATLPTSQPSNDNAETGDDWKEGQFEFTVEAANVNKVHTIHVYNGSDWKKAKIWITVESSSGNTGGTDAQLIGVWPGHAENWNTGMSVSSTGDGYYQWDVTPSSNGEIKFQVKVGSTVYRPKGSNDIDMTNDATKWEPTQTTENYKAFYIRNAKSTVTYHIKFGTQNKDINTTWTETENPGVTPDIPNWTTQFWYSIDGVTTIGKMTDGSGAKDWTYATYEFTPEKSGEYLITVYRNDWNDKWIAAPNSNTTMSFGNENGTRAEYNDCSTHNNDNQRFKIQLDANYTYKVEFWPSYDGKKRLWITKTSLPTLTVFPKGVTNTTGLNAYNDWPIVYLQADVLNFNRISPEYQMNKRNDGKYELLVTMHDTDNVYVEKYTSKDAKATRSANQSFRITVGNEGLRNAGHLYLAVYDPTTDSLDFEDQGEDMPFLSMIGKDWKQNTVANGNKPYQTPFPYKDAGDYIGSYKDKPRDTDYGWQESWIQYADGNLLKDRSGKVMYTTIWPPVDNGDVKFKTAFTVNGTSYDFTLSSDQLTFVPQNNGVSKSGSDWLSDSRFKGVTTQSNLTTDLNGTEIPNRLALNSGAEYVLYSVDDMWINGDAKLWTGWGGQTDGNGRYNSIWFANWGHYGAKDYTTQIHAGATVPLGTEKGDMTFPQPTYFKHVYFFLDKNNPQVSQKCVLYTMLSYGGGQIAALSRNNYTYGMYQPKLTDTSNIQNADILSVVITSWDSDLKEQQFVVFNKTYNDKKVSDWNSLFTFNEDGSWVYDGNIYNVGDYKYKMQVVVNDPASGRHTIDVVSNPFTIYQTDQRVSVTPYQLVQKVGKPNEYITYAESMEDAIYDVVDNNGVITRTRVILDEDEPIDYGNSEKYTFTDKVLLVGSSLNIKASEVNSYSLNINGSDANVEQTAKQPSTGRFMQIISAPLAEQTYGLKMNYHYSFIDSTTGIEQESDKNSVETAVSRLALTVPSPKVNDAKVEVFFGTANGEGNDNDKNATKDFKYKGQTGQIFDLKAARYQSVRESADIESPNVTSNLQTKMKNNSEYNFKYYSIRDNEEKTKNYFELDENWNKKGNLVKPSALFDTEHPDATDENWNVRTLHYEYDNNVYPNVYDRWGEGKITSISITENPPVDDPEDDSDFIAKINSAALYYNNDGDLISEFEAYIQVVGRNQNDIEHEDKDMNGDTLLHGDTNTGRYDYFYVTIVDKASVGEDNQYAIAIVNDDATELKDKYAEWVYTVEDLDKINNNGGMNIRFRKNYGHYYDGQLGWVMNNPYYKNLELRVSYLYPFDTQNPAASAPRQGMFRMESDLTGDVVKSPASALAFYSEEVPTGVEGLEGDASSVKAGVGFIEVTGRGVEIYNAQGVQVGAGEGRYEVGAGVYVVRVNGLTQKVIVR